MQSFFLVNFLFEPLNRHLPQLIQRPTQQLAVTPGVFLVVVGELPLDALEDLSIMLVVLPERHEVDSDLLLGCLGGGV